MTTENTKNANINWSLMLKLTIAIITAVISVLKEREEIKEE